MSEATISIVCHPNDVHVELVTAYLRKKFSRNVVIVCSADASDVIALEYNAKVTHRRADFGLIWVRRKRHWELDRASQIDINTQLNIAQSDEDVLHEFLLRNKNICVNHPEVIVRLENKATQLRLAAQAGFKIPDTLISASYKRVKEFVWAHSEVVIKNLRPYGGQPTGTFKFDGSLLTEENCSKSFAIYQQEIQGRNHFRIVVLGNDVYAFRYESDKVDSRLDARNAAEYVGVDNDFSKKLAIFMELAGLTMGIFDIKESRDGEWYFLEVNQQGAFAYLDPLSGFPILRTVAEFLHNRSLCGVLTS